MAFLPRTIARTGLTLTNSATTSPVIDNQDSRGIVLYTGSDLNSNTTATVYACATEDGTYVPLQDTAGADVAVGLQASYAHEIPSGVFACKYIRLVTNSGTLAADVTYKS